MTTILGPRGSRATGAPGPGAGAAPVPAATRARRPGWRDPRLWVGLAIVAGCVVGGARIMATADDTVPVWTLRADRGAGAVLSAEDLETRRVRFASGEDADRYLSADDALATGATLTRDVGGGELLARSSVTTEPAAPLSRVTVVFAGAGAPAGLREGDRVDVYLTSVTGARATGEGSAVAAVRSALVLAVDAAAGGLTGAGGREVTLGTPPATDLAPVVQAAATDHLYLVQVG